MGQTSWGPSENTRWAKFYESTSAARKRLPEEAENWNLPVAIASALAARPEEV